jgi:hypothetical protein
MNAKKHYCVLIFGVIIISAIHFIFFANYFYLSFFDFLNLWLDGYRLSIFRFNGMFILPMIISITLMFFGVVVHKKYAIALFLVGFTLSLLIGTLAAGALV